jgi:transposase
MWALLAIAPLPAKAKRLSVSRIETVFKTYRIRRISAGGSHRITTRVLGRHPHSAEAIAEHVGTLLPLLRAFHAQYKYVSSSLKNLLNDVLADPQREEHRTVKLLRPLPGVGIDASTTFLAEAAGLLAQADGRAFRCYAGIAPITKQSGKSKRVNMRNGAISACGRPAITGLERAFSAIQAADHITIGCGKWDTVTGELCAASATV